MLCLVYFMNIVILTAAVYEHAATTATIISLYMIALVVAHIIYDVWTATAETRRLRRERQHG